MRAAAIAAALAVVQCLEPSAASATTHLHVQRTGSQTASSAKWAVAPTPSSLTFAGGPLGPRSAELHRYEQRSRTRGYDVRLSFVHHGYCLGIGDCNTEFLRSPLEWIDLHQLVGKPGLHLVNGPSAQPHLGPVQRCELDLRTGGCHECTRRSCDVDRCHQYLCKIVRSSRHFGGGNSELVSVAGRDSHRWWASHSTPW